MSDPIYGGTAGCCLYWIDRNENKDTPTVSAGATFNVDNPSFWTNLSVLSGLASGYCERLAVAKLASAGTAVTAGAKVTLVAGNTWTMGPTIAADVNENDNIVSKVINGFALGKTDASLFTTSQAAFRTVGTSLGSNYMKAVDSAIVSMCDILGGYVQGANDTNAYTFSDLATAAKARSEIESVAGSAIDKPTANGGVLARKGALAYPVAWAKQRKWMLDTLRYTGSAAVATSADMVYYNTIEYNTASNFSFTGSNMVPAISSAYTRTVSSGIDSAYSIITSTTYDQYPGPVFTYMTSGAVIKSPADDRNTVPYALGFSNSATSLTVGMVIQAYCGENAYYAQAYRTWDEADSVKISGNTDSYTVASDTKYVVTENSDVTLYAATNVIISALSISSGCTAHLPNNITASYINIMSGGCIIPTGVDGSVCNLHAAAWYADYRPTILYDFLGSCRYTTGTSTGALDSSYFVNGGTLTIPARTSATDVYVTGTTSNRGLVKLTGSGGSNVMSSVLVGAYGFLSGTGSSTDLTAANAVANTVAILSGGTATLQDVYLGELKIYSGGIANLERCRVDFIDLLDGATLNVTDNSLTNNIISGISAVRIGTFQAFPLQVQSGWNTFRVQQASTAPGGVAYVTGVDSSSAAGALLDTDVVSAVTNQVPVIGGTWHSGSVTSGMSTLLPRLTSSIVWQNFSVLAINGGTAQSTVNHYEDFRVRQWSEDPAAT